MHGIFGAAPARARRARLLLTPLLLVIVVAATVAPFHSVMTVDDRTYLEMIDGISRHGLPYVENGPSERFGELRPQWDLARGDRLWGTYPPLFTYAAVPFYLLDGARGVVRFNVLLLMVIALGAFSLGRRLTDDPIVGVAAAYATLLSTPVWTFTLMLSSYTLAIAAITWAVERGVAALAATGPAARRLAMASGACGGCAVGSHLLTLPMTAAIVLLLLVLPSVERPDAWCTRASLERGVCAVAAAALLLAPVAAINYVRFGTPNPISYGPCLWHHCDESGLGKQNVGAMLRFAAPAAAWLVASTLAVWSLRRRRLAALAAAAVSLSLLYLSPLILARAHALFAVGVSLLVDMSPRLGGEFRTASDGRGQFLGAHVIKSALQSTPALALAALVHAKGARGRPVLWMVAAPALALYGSLVLRANLPLAYALGYPFLHFRYLMPLAPLIAVLAVVAVRHLRWQTWHLLAVAAAAIAVGGWLLTSHDDASPLRRVVLLRASLIVGAGALVITSLARRSTAAPTLCALCFGFGIAVALGVDLPALVRLRLANDRTLDRVAELTPPRVALVGWGRQVDPVLALRRTRDIEYADLYEADDWRGFRALIAHWSREQRPIYALFPRDHLFHSPWADVRFSYLDAQLGLVAVLPDP